MTLVMDGSFFAQTGRTGHRRESAGVFEQAMSDQPRRGFVLEVPDGVIPVWIDEVVRRLNVAVAAPSAEPDWQPMTRTAVIKGLQALRSVMNVDSARPSLTPTPEGGLQFEWHDGADPV